ncbi:hypothetical protein QT970_20835 [Microcoleus sp. herbarium8]
MPALLTVNSQQSTVNSRGGAPVPALLTVNSHLTVQPEVNSNLKPKIK